MAFRSSRRRDRVDGFPFPGLHDPDDGVRVDAAVALDGDLAEALCAHAPQARFPGHLAGQSGEGGHPGPLLLQNHRGLFAAHVNDAGLQGQGFPHQDHLPGDHRVGPLAPADFLGAVVVQGFLEGRDFLVHVLIRDEGEPLGLEARLEFLTNLGPQVLPGGLAQHGKRKNRHLFQGQFGFLGRKRPGHKQGDEKNRQERT